jgi:CTP:molybdopterin cytidylyltransferase MocA
MIAIVVLAAGSSSRMGGRDKLMEQIDGMPLLRRTVLRALEAGCDVSVALPEAPHPRHDALADLPVRRVPVPAATEGMNASLRAGLAALPPQTEAVMVMLADMPDITTQDMKDVLQAVDLISDTLIWRATTQSGDAGHPIVFRATLIPALIALNGDAGGSAVVKANRAHTLHVPLPGTHARTDLDTPQAWADWRARQEPI